MQDDLEKTKKTTYFKLTLLNTENNLKEAISVSGTSEQFLMHVCTAVHVCKQIRLYTNHTNALMVLEAAYYKLDATK